jgi:hypothetical protein
MMHGVIDCKNKQLPATVPRRKLFSEAIQRRVMSFMDVNSGDENSPPVC